MIMRTLRLALIIFATSLISCERDTTVDSNEEFVPTDVLVKVKRGHTIDQVFDFINSFDHEVENIHSQKHTSDLPSDSLDYVLDYLNQKTYTNDGNNWFVTGYLHYQTQVITIFPRLFDIKNTTYQADWLESMEILKLEEDTISENAGCIIYFHVPEGDEQEWVSKFEDYEFIEWAELNYYVDMNPWP